MNIDNKLDELRRIKQVDAPPFLYTRIMQQIENLAEIPVSIKWRWAYAASAILILALNLSILLNQNITDKNSSIESVVSGMQLTNTNLLYNE